MDAILCKCSSLFTAFFVSVVILFGQAPDKKIIYWEWLDNTNNTATFDTIFQPGNWEELYYYYNSPASVLPYLDSNTCMIYIECDGNTTNFINFVQEYISELEEWVYNGGHLFFNGEFNIAEYGGIEVDLGFDNTKYVTDLTMCLDENCPSIADSSHVIFSGPLWPNNSLTGNFYYNRTYLIGSDLNPIILDSLSGNIILAEKFWGDGKVVFGTFYNPFITPFVFDYSGDNNYTGANILWYLSSCLHQQNDLGIIKYNLPVDKCNLTENETIDVTIRNFGDIAQTNFNVHYKLNEDLTISELFTDTIKGGFTGDFTFSALADLNDYQENEIRAWTSLDLDTVAENDTLKLWVKSKTPFTDIGLPGIVCPEDGLITATPDFAGGFWEGTGIIDSYNGIFDPSIVGVGNSSVISYSYDVPYDYLKEEIDYNFYEPGTPLFLDLTDNEYERIEIGFEFTYFDHVFDSIYINSQGLATFDYGYNYSSLLLGGEPTGGNLIGLVSCSELFIPNGGNIYYETIGEAPDRKFIITFNDVHYWYPPDEGATAQLILHENNNAIEFQNTLFAGDEEPIVYQGFCNKNYELCFYTRAEGEPGNWDQVFEKAYIFSPLTCDSTVSQVIHITESDAGIFPIDTLICSLDGGLLNSGYTGLPLLWSTGDTTQSIFIFESGIYSVIFYGDNCIFYDTIVVNFSDPVSFLVETTPSLAGSNTGTATVEVLSGSEPFTYLWNDGQTTATAVGLSSGNYTVLVTDLFGCEVEEQVFIDEYLEILNANDYATKIYPIPTNDILFIESKQSESFQIFNLSGKLLMEGLIYDNLTHLSLDSLQPGVYFIQLKDNARLESRKIILIK